MKDFFVAALPWCIMGLCLAIFFVNMAARSKQDKADESQQAAEHKGSADNTATGMCIGMCLGVALGTAMDHLALGISLGMLLGIVLGSGIKQ